MFSPGTAFVWDGHVWFALSDPNHLSGQVLCVNLTSLDEDCPDDECLLTHHDYAWIEDGHPTAVAFSRSRLWDAKKLDGVLAAGVLERPFPDTVPLHTLDSVREAAKASKQISAIKKAFL